jgi:HK97 family phage portal protein
VIGLGAALVSRRPVSAATGRWVASGGAVATALSGVFRAIDRAGQLDSMAATGTLFQIVSTFANATSLAPWSMVESATVSDDPRRPPAVVGDHPALRLWNKPNLHYTGQELIESVQQHVELTGEGYLLVDRHPALGLPYEMWPIRPDRMEPVPDRERFLAGWIYTGADGQMIPLGVDEVIQIRQPHPLDPYRGFGAIQAIISEIDTAALSAEWNRNFFRNGARPLGVVELPADSRARAEEIESFKAQWREQFQGVRNAHRVAVLEKGAQWKDTQFSARDMQFTEMRKTTREDIREAFGISKTMLGQTEEVNRATAEAAIMVFRRDKLKPRLTRWQQAINNDLLPMYGKIGQGVEFRFDAQIPTDATSEAALLKARAEAAQRLAVTGWDPDEVLAEVGLPPMRWKGSAA